MLTERPGLDDENIAKWVSLEPWMLMNYILLESNLENIKNKINSGTISKFNIISKVKEALFEIYNEKHFDDVSPVKDHRAEKYFSDQSYQGLQVFRITGGGKAKGSKRVVSYYNEPKDAGSFDATIIRTQREILSEWRHSNIAELKKLADSFKDSVECELNIFSVQIAYIEIGHACQHVRKFLYEVFDDEKKAWKTLSLRELLNDVDKKMKYTHDNDMDRILKVHGLVGNYFNDVTALKEVIKSTETVKAFEEVLFWLEKIRREIDKCEREYPNFEKVYGEYVNATKCASIMRQLVGHGINGNISELNHCWLLNIPNFHEFYKREDGLPKEQKYLHKVQDILEKLQYSTYKFASKFELNPNCEVVGPKQHEHEEKEIQNNMDRDLTLDSLSLGLKVIKVSGTKAVVPYNKRTESEIYNLILNLASRDFEGESEEKKIRRLIYYAKGQARPSDIAILLCELEQLGHVVVKKGKGRSASIPKSSKAGKNVSNKIPTEPAAMR